jgi:hypothetical protein
LRKWFSDHGCKSCVFVIFISKSFLPVTAAIGWVYNLFLITFFVSTIRNHP